ncbi:phospholipid/cholesterol/gamma-HCH transport system permease protein [Pseudochelatococcus lubricantis]|uniref:Phospholipid/cholesterol/gamma-HCH transport system permease protein n=1 Tax=Pseudochelatococcus lubricantis TaxID=1538102 RepID=A0ABX0UUL1_9HYPH|nr:ABC transporter permease [Pseudochelatococcus lubricantis]NIJ56656.1 phospholipid/cholesterol/gamma-HCH transport system permease protein [Pseudochelatococcus lubricantis]
MTTDPNVAIDESSGATRLVVTGDWVSTQATAVEEQAALLARQLAGDGSRTQDVAIDLGEIGRLDTVGAWVLDRARQEGAADGRKAPFVNTRPDHLLLLEKVHYREVERPPAAGHWRLIDFLASVGESVVDFGREMGRGVSFLGEVVAGLARLVVHPGRFRFPAFVNQMEQTAFRSVPIVTLISFLVGCIVAQQGIFQMQRFGAAMFVVDLTGILVLRELGVLLTSIMIAGRSGSAFTAELGSMKMREEIDALRVMGLDPVEVLIVPRVLALLVGLPMLTFLASMAALLGGGLVAWIYGGITPDIFLARLKAAIDFSTFMVGLVKAPFMALVIGIIASHEGMAVGGSAESLGRQVTASVVKAIFMVIVMDGLFAVFFAAINF